MKWKVKSAVQRICSSLPAGRESSYYFIQKTFGSLGRPHDPFPMWTEFVRMAALIAEAGIKVEGSRVMEIGSGRRLDMPLAFFLAGAESVITFDLNRYLKPELVMQSIDAIRQNRAAVRELFSSITDPQTLDARLNAITSAQSFLKLMELARMEYRAPADAADTGLPAHSIDLQFSYTVFEHIPEPVLESILKEASRILSPSGAALHHIDPSDHFSHEDFSIPPINFLQFSERDWNYYGGNQFAYHNRLRVDDFAGIYQRCGHDVLQWKPKIDQASLKLVENGFPLDPAFRSKTPEQLCTIVLHVLSRPARS